MLKRLLVVSAVLFAVSSCKKNDKQDPPAAAGSATAGSAAVGSAAAGSAGSAAAPVPAAEKPATPPPAEAAAGSGAVSEQELDAAAKRTAEFMDQVTDVAKAATPDCAAMADKLEALFKSNEAFRNDILSLDKRLSAEQKKSLGGKMNAATQRFQTEFPPAFQPCANNNEVSERVMKLFASMDNEHQ
jgi:hypothetical protein